MYLFCTFSNESDFDGGFHPKCSKFTRDEKEKENEYWINDFNTSFPGGNGLDPFLRLSVNIMKRKYKI